MSPMASVLMAQFYDRLRRCLNRLRSCLNGANAPDSSRCEGQSSDVELVEILPVDFGVWKLAKHSAC